MYTVTPDLAKAVTRSHTPAFAAEIRQAGTVVARGLEIVGGSITVDRSAAVRRSGTIQIAGFDADLIPTMRRRSPLDPYGNEIALWRGVRYSDGNQELVPQGVFRITGTGLRDTADGMTMEIRFSDRSRSVARAKLTAPYVTARGSNIVTAITALVNDRLPNNPQVVLSQVAYTTPVTVLAEQADPWAAGVEKLATAAAVEAYFDRQGSLVVRPVPDPSVDPVVLSLAEGPDCVVTALERDYDDEDTYNGVIITGESGANAAVRGSAFDMDPASPTYWFGAYGQVPTWESNDLATTGVQAQAIANARILDLVGLSEQVVVEMVPNPALDASDVIYVERERSGFADTLLVESFSLPMVYSGSVSVTCRTRRVA